MSDTDTDHFRRLQDRYRRREMPWDHELPPPEIMAAAERLEPGAALDLGCGTARAGVYLAARGWRVDGIDFVPEAIELATARVAAAGLADRVRLHEGSVTDMRSLSGPYELAIDVGCMHGLDAGRQLAYAGEVTRLVRPGGTYLLFVHLREPGDDEGRPGTPDGSVEALFGEAFEFVTVEPGMTTVGEDRWRSAWYELRRKALNG
jgi:SAM-dependent methyltransferase